MTVTERLMGIGKWNLRLIADTPRSLLDALQVRRTGVGFGHVVITPTRAEIGLGDELLSIARYTGIYRRQESEFEMAGAGLPAWIADEDGKGPAYTGTIGGAWSFADWVTALRPSALLPGVTSSIGGTFEKQYFRTGLRKPLDEVCAAFGAEWRVNPDFTFDIGTPGELFELDPRAVILRKAADGGRDYNVHGVVGDLAVKRDLEDWIRRAVHYLGTEDAPVIGTADGGVAAFDVPYRRPDGAAINMDYLTEDFGEAGSPTTEANRLAGLDFGRLKDSRQELTVKSVSYDIGQDVRVGDNVWVFDSLRGIYDVTNQVPYRGQIVYPESIRCVGQTWAIRQGMGVFLRTFVKGASTWEVRWTDLTNFIAWETGDTTVEVGDKPRT